MKRCSHIKIHKNDKVTVLKSQIQWCSDRRGNSTREPPHLFPSSPQRLRVQRSTLMLYSLFLPPPLLNSLWIFQSHTYFPIFLKYMPSSSGFLCQSVPYPTFKVAIISWHLQLTSTRHSMRRTRRRNELPGHCRGCCALCCCPTDCRLPARRAIPICTNFLDLDYTIRDKQRRKR